MTQLDALWAYIRGQDTKLEKRVTYMTGLENLKANKETVVIIDESDQILFSNLKLFAKKTLSEKIHVICLTATADDGFKAGAERKVLELFKFKIYRNVPQAEIIAPRIHERRNFGDLVSLQKTIEAYEMK